MKNCRYCEHCGYENSEEYPDGKGGYVYWSYLVCKQSGIPSDYEEIMDENDAETCPYYEESECPSYG